LEGVLLTLLRYRIPIRRWDGSLPRGTNRGRTNL
jgi:hypothetical protein